MKIGEAPKIQSQAVKDFYLHYVLQRHLIPSRNYPFSLAFFTLTHIIMSVFED